MSLDPDKLAEIVEVARELDRQDRSDYLNEVTAGDDALRAQIEQALDSLERGGRANASASEAATQPAIGPGDFSAGELGDSAAEAETQDESRPGMPSALRNDLFAQTEMPGSMIGRYKLLQKIGEGGFGAVFMAQQEQPVRRRVALKVIKAGMDTRQVIARFEAERQALAMMDHPFIAKVLDAGATESGRPYFVMELVKGIPVTQYCDQARLDTHARLELFTDICAAIQHAHLKGVIHRDLKPSNIMVTLHGGAPVIKVIDFGIAKAMDRQLTEKTLFTNYGQMIGTPSYMSPEQAVMSGLDVDTRSDVYSLGVLLYELLTGDPPLDDKTLRQAGFDEMRRIIREESPPKPSTRLSTLDDDARVTIADKRQSNPQVLGRELRGDLDWIVMKALEKDRGRRYESASAFAQDIVRYLHHEPVEAAAPSAAYRVRKFVQRHKGPVTAAAAIAVLLVTGTTVSTWLAVRAIDAEGQAVRNLAAAEAERDRATEAEQRAKRAESRAIDNLVIAETERDERAIAARDAKAIAAFFVDVFRRPNPRLDGRTITVKQALDRAAAQIETDLTIAPHRKARLRVALGDTYYGLGLFNLAADQLEQARGVFERDLGSDNPETLLAMERLAFVYHDQGRREDAAALREHVLERRLESLGPEAPDTIKAMNNQANSYADAGEDAQALAIREEVLRLSRQVLGQDHQFTLTAMTNLANSYHRAGRRGDALQLREAVVPAYEAHFGPRYPDTIKAMSNLANSYSSFERYDKALRIRERVAKLSPQVLGEDHPDTLVALENLATSYYHADRLDAARDLRERVVELRTRYYGAQDTRTLIAMGNLANAYNALGRQQDALDLREQVAQAFERKLGRLDMHTLIALHNLANSYQETGRWDESLALRNEVLINCTAVFGDRHDRTIWAMDSLATTLAEHRQTDKAIAVLEDASGRRPDDLELALQLAALYVWFEREADYQAIRGRVMRALSDGEASDHDEVVALRIVSLQLIHEQATREAVLSLAGRVAGQRFETASEEAGAALALGMAYDRCGRDELAIEHYAQAVGPALDADPLAADASSLTAALGLAGVYGRRGDLQQSRRFLNWAGLGLAPKLDEDHPLAEQADYEALLKWLAYREALRE